MDRPRPTSALLALLGAVLLGAGAAVLLTSGPAAATSADDRAAPPGVSVTGVGTASGPPDVLRFTVGVQVVGASVDGALASANTAAARTIAALEARGVAPADVQTAQVRIDPRYDSKGQAITGYVVHSDVRVTVRDVAGAGATIGAAVTAGGDAARLSGVSFDLEDDDALRRTARDRAFAEARATAEQYARLAGKQLGAVESVSEQVRPQGWPTAELDAAASRAADVPVEPGSTEVVVEVQARWALR